MYISKAIRCWLPWLMATMVSAIAVGQQQDDDSPILVGDSGVGYIDSAVLGNQVRFRFESAYDIDRANRAEFIWAWPPPLGNGPAGTEISTDYQSLSCYLERQWSDNFSGFVELAGLLSNPVINDNSGGLGDMNAGFKCALLRDHRRLTTAQLRVYIPTGDADRGLGTNHVSMEPSLLHYRRLSSIWTSESELRYFFPIGGTENKRGPMFRYGTGLSCLLFENDCQRISPVAEVVGWTVLDGQQSFIDSGGAKVIQNAHGDTIVNAKLGCRWQLGGDQFYVGYGRALTSDVWYEDVLRVEWRRSY